MAFQGRLIAGVGKALRVYDMGKKRLLRKTENRVGAFTFSVFFETQRPCCSRSPPLS